MVSPAAVGSSTVSMLAPTITRKPSHWTTNNSCMKSDAHSGEHSVDDSVSTAISKRHALLPVFAIVELSGRLEQLHANEVLAVSRMIVPNDPSRNLSAPFKF